MAASSSKKQIHGQFTHPVINSQTPTSDPWERAYYAPLSAKAPPTDLTLPTGLKPTSHYVNEAGNKQVIPGDDGARLEAQRLKLANQTGLHLAFPVRMPHLDFTPLGTRQLIRAQSHLMYETAVQAGVIAHEDQICATRAVLATTKEADAAISAECNEGGVLGPRYDAAYTIWQPLRKVVRDSLALGVRAGPDASDASGKLVYWPYDDRLPGMKELKGDHLKEYAMLGVEAEEKPAAEEGERGLQWFYVDGQEADEILVVKMFDSATLGQAGKQEAAAPWHASLETGVEGGEARESINTHVLAFW